jgi:hypothetical protein
MSDIDREEIRRRVIRRFYVKVFKIGTFAIHAMAWCWTAFYGVTNNPDWSGAIPVMLLWGAIIFLHGIWALELMKNPWTNWVERATEAEIERVNQRVGGETTLEKRKHTMRLSDDGELDEITPMQSAAQQKSKR